MIPINIKAFTFNRCLLMSVMALLLTACSKKFYPYSKQKVQPVSALSLTRYKQPHLRNGQDAKSVLGISISGGGSRAMCFGIGVLLGLENIKTEKSNLLNEADYISTVSGGGFAAGYYLARKNHFESLNPDSVGEFSFNSLWNHSSDYKTLMPNVDLSTNPVKNIFIYNTLSSKARMRHYYSEIRNNVMFADEVDDIRPLSLKGVVDRKVIRKRVHQFNHNNYLDILELKDFYIPKSSNKELKLPILISNGTLFENNARMALVPHLFDTLNWLSLCPGTHVDRVKPSEAGGSTNLPIYYTITASAAFPGVLPQMRGTCPGEREIRIIDGGVGDNFGYKSLFDVFDELGRTNKEIKTKALIVIDASGIGYGSPYSTNERQTIFSIAAKQLYSTLESKYPDAFIEIKSKDSLDKSFNYSHIGITSLIEFADPKFMPQRIISGGKVSWNDLLKDFKQYLKIKDTWEIYRMKPESVVKVPEAIWLLYELAAHVSTRLQVSDTERAILVLAGKTCVYLKRNSLTKLLDTN